VDYESDFFTSCVSVVTQQEGNGSPVSPTVTFVTTTAFGDQASISKDIPKGILSQPYPGAVSDLYGFPTNPICIYRTGDEWPAPQGPESQRVPSEARPVFNHHLRDVWPTLDIKSMNSSIPLE
jgi:hypothetical protein